MMDQIAVQLLCGLSVGAILYALVSWKHSIGVIRPLDALAYRDKAAELPARATANIKLARAFDLSNQFTCADPKIHRALNKIVLEALLASSMVDQLGIARDLLPTVDLSQCELHI